MEIKGIAARAYRLLAASFFALAAVNVQASSVESMRLWAAPDHARLVFDLSAATNANVFSLENPARLVIDLDDTQMDTDPSTLPLHDSAITSVRTGVREGGGLRVVLELNREIEPRHFTLTPNDSTVTDWSLISNTLVRVPSRIRLTPLRR